jgi:hypothetical protein
MVHAFSESRHPVGASNHYCWFISGGSLVTCDVELSLPRPQYFSKSQPPSSPWQSSGILRGVSTRVGTRPRPARSRVQSTIGGKCDHRLEREQHRLATGSASTGGADDRSHTAVWGAHMPRRRRCCEDTHSAWSKNSRGAHECQSDSSNHSPASNDRIHQSEPL